MNEEITFIPDRLNEEPVVFLSMSNSELKLAVLVCLAVWTPICLIIGIIVGKVMLSVAGVMVMTYLTIWLGGKKLRQLKRGKPKQYHVMAISAYLEDKGLKMKTMIRESKVWDIKRSQTMAQRIRKEKMENDHERL